MTYISIIKDHQVLTDRVDSHEHITFLTYWLSEYIFYARPVQVANKHVCLVTQLPEWRNICLIRCKMFTSIVAPFSSRQCGPKWFMKPFPNLSQQEEKNIHVTLNVCFNLKSLCSRLTSSKSGIKVAHYQRNLASRKFSLSQLLPKSLVPQGEGRKIAKTSTAKRPSRTKQLDYDIDDSSDEEVLSPQKESEFDISDDSLQSHPPIPPKHQTSTTIKIVEPNFDQWVNEANAETSSIGRKKKVMRETVTVFEDEGTEESEVPPVK
ncbi:hypothetical protein KIW84_076195 [Lathyrus oleraceus]|uniref:Aminotransferase-like plant mobile domain-containing protein n=1 Tax=Pisum sativum TaxID=3888 RepID=A0A9D5A0V7_PEA|nr:hypothetical protein KIW84_076195 [Pisum sativum]